MSQLNDDKIKINVNSEYGELETVIIHTPGQEVENMTPENAERALYSDILNLSEATREYSQFKAVLEKHSRTIEIRPAQRYFDERNDKEKFGYKYLRQRKCFSY